MKRRAKRKSVNPVAPGDWLPEVFRGLDVGAQVHQYRMMRAFQLAIGERLARVARAEKLVGKTLYIRVASSSWSHELSILRAPVLSKLHELVGPSSVESLRFSVGPLTDIPDWT